MSSFCQHRNSPSSCVRCPGVLLLFFLLISSASTCNGSKSQSSIVNGLGEWEFGRAADAVPRRNKKVESGLGNRKLAEELPNVQSADNDEALRGGTSLSTTATSSRPPIRALRQSRRFKLFLPSAAESFSSSSGATAADALDRYLSSGEDDIFFSHSFSHSYEDDSSEERDSGESSDSGDSADVAVDNAPEGDSVVQEEDEVAEELTSAIERGMACLNENSQGGQHEEKLNFEYEIEQVDPTATKIARGEITIKLLEALKGAFSTCANGQTRALQDVDSFMYKVRRNSETVGVEYIEVTSDISPNKDCTVMSDVECSVEMGTVTVIFDDPTDSEQVNELMMGKALATFSEVEGGIQIPDGKIVAVRVIKPMLTAGLNERADISDKSTLQVTEIIVPQEASASTPTLSPTALTFGCVGALFFGIAVALLQYRRKRSQLGSDDDSASGVSIWSAKPPALAAGESDDESATTALSHAPAEPTNLPIPGAPASSPIVMVKMYGDGKNTVETTAPDYLPPNVPPAICFELMEEKRATPASCAITIDDSEI